MARTFDPKKHQDSAGGNGGGKWLETAGEYLLVVKSFKRDWADKSGKEYLQCTFEVIYGPMKGRKFTSRVFLNDAAIWKLARMCEAMDYEETFDLDDNAAVRDAICYRPFKAKVSVSSGRKRKFCDVDEFLEPSDEEADFCDRWVAEHEAERETAGTGGAGPSDFDEPDDPGPEPPADFGDDDIPF